MCHFLCLIFFCGYNTPVFGVTWGKVVFFLLTPCNTVDGLTIRGAPVGMVNIPWFIGLVMHHIDIHIISYIHIPQLVRQISEPSTISFEDFTAKVSIFYFLLWVLFGPKVFETLLRNLQEISVDWMSPLFVALVIHFRFLVLWFVCRGFCLKTMTSDFNHSICNIPLWCLW